MPRRLLLPLSAVVLCMTAATDACAESPFQTQNPSTGLLLLSRLGVPLIVPILGYLVGVLFSPKLAKFRELVATAFVFLLLVVALSYLIWGPYPEVDSLVWAGSSILGFFAFAAGCHLGYVAPPPVEPSRPTSLGSAQWASLAALSRAGLLGNDGFIIGAFRRAGAAYPLSYQGTRHLLTVAPTRSGKGVSSIIPNLLTYGGSAVIVDPKGENALVTAWRRGAGHEGAGGEGLGLEGPGIEGMDQAVHLLDPWNIAAAQLGLEPARFNPLDWIKAGDPDAAENAFLLADALVPEDSGKGEARFWDDEAKALLTGIILYVATAAQEEGRRHLGRVRDILIQDDAELVATLTAMFDHDHPVVVSTATRTAGKEPKLRNSVITSAQAHTHFLDSPRIRASLTDSTVDFGNLKTTPTTVYVILPADRLTTFDRWMRLIIQQAITINARNVAQAPDKPILFLLDEMAALGRLKSVEQAFGLMAGFGMQLWGIVQDLSQLARVYGENSWQTFISNSGVVQYFGSRDKMTAEYFSSLCGVYTVETRSLTTAISRALGFTSGSSSGNGQFSSSSGRSDTSSFTTTIGANEAQRQLAYPDELMVLKDHQQIVFIENVDPIAAEKVRWYAHPALQRLGHSLRPLVLVPVAVPNLPARAPRREPLGVRAGRAAAQAVAGLRSWAVATFRRRRQVPGDGSALAVVQPGSPLLRLIRRYDGLRSALAVLAVLVTPVAVFATVAPTRWAHAWGLSTYADIYSVPADEVALDVHTGKRAYVYAGPKIDDKALGYLDPALWTLSGRVIDPQNAEWYYVQWRNADGGTYGGFARSIDLWDRGN